MVSRIHASPRSPRVFLWLGVFVACGPSSSQGDTDPTSVTATNGTSTDSDSSDHTSTETQGGTETDADTDIETDGDQVCDPPVDDEPGPSTATITIRNDSNEPRFVAPWSPFACNYAKLEILVDGESLHWDHDHVYNYPCDECGWGCSDGGDTGLLINPGATAEVLWTGAAWTTTELSEACALEVCEEEDVEAFECEVRRNLERVEYVARAHIYDSCPDGVAEDACVCDEDVCEVFFYEPGMGESTAEASATFPDGATIVLR